jgi:D-alanyl-lipoteichoic acid acyltransferase DltB (MBOAT superfamily)
MLFNSYPFLLLFLPITLAGYFLLARMGRTWAAAWLAAASLFFYAWWDYRYVALLLASIIANYFAGKELAHRARSRHGQWLLAVAIASNLGLLAYYKYADFFIGSANAAFGRNISLLHIVLPLGISFFTFTQIAFLVDAYRGLAKEYRFVHYVLFVTYFPHLVAGPVLHHKEMMPQFDLPRNYRPHASDLSIGATIFVIGLAKKLLIADNLSEYAAGVFDTGEPASFLVAWGGVLAYTFQLYFDFSGYSDMAIGLSRLFGVRLPLNFNSPYKAVNIIEFWRRWHMTLSRFLRDYLYIALGGNRNGPMRRQINLMATMLLGGLWHGAGWNFVIWGGMHGVFLVANHAWQALRPSPGRTSTALKAASVAFTFLCVTLAWVFFRAADLPTAMRVLAGLSGGYGFAIPEALVNRLPLLRPLIDAIGITTYLGGTSKFVLNWALVFVAGIVVFLFPNSQELLRRYRPAFSNGPRVLRTRLTWRPNVSWAIGVGALAAICFLSLSRPTEFLYFQF